MKQQNRVSFLSGVLLGILLTVFWIVKKSIALPAVYIFGIGLLIIFGEVFLFRKLYPRIILSVWHFIIGFGFGALFAWLMFPQIYL